MIWRDGEIVSSATASPPARASWGAFTTAGSAGGRPLLWERHHGRLQATLGALGADDAVPLPTEVELVHLLAAVGVDGHGAIRVVARCTGDDGAWSVEASAEARQGCGPDAPPLALAPVYWSAAPPLAGHKSLARLPWDLARRQAIGAGADDALLVDVEHRVLETAIANVLMVRDGRVVTPPAPLRCLPGILRGWLLERLAATGRPVEVRDLELDELVAADEVWTSNAVQGVRRVGRVGDRRWHAWPVFATLIELRVPAPGWPVGGERGACHR